MCGEEAVRDKRSKAAEVCWIGSEKCGKGALYDVRMEE